MGRSHVVFRGNDFEAHDLDQMVWSEYAKRAISGLPNVPQWLAEMWNRLGVPYSFVSILDRFLTDAGRIDAFLAINRHVIREMELRGDSIPLEELREIDTDMVKWIKPFETRFILDFARRLDELIRMGAAGKRGARVPEEMGAKGGARAATEE